MAEMHSPFTESATSIKARWERMGLTPPCVSGEPFASMAEVDRAINAIGKEIAEARIHKPARRILTDENMIRVILLADFIVLYAVALFAGR